MAEFDPLDISVFRELSQSSENDRRSLLRIKAVVRARKPGYRYVEIGSFLGGTLLPHLLDPACASLLSIDKRPQGPQPDARGEVWAEAHTYEGVSTALMLQFLEQYVSAEQLVKLATIDADAATVTLDAIGVCDLALIDGEHTDAAVLSDVTSLLPALAEDAVIAFHDVDLVKGGIDAAMAGLRDTGIPHRLFLLPDVVGALALGGSIEAAAEAFGQTV